MIRTGIIGIIKETNPLIRNIRSVEGYSVTGVCSPLIHPPPGIAGFCRLDDLISASDALIISGIPGDLEKTVEKALKKSKHIMLFPDASLTRVEIEKFEKLAEEAGVILMLHNKNLQNRMPLLLKHYFGKPEYMEVRRCLNNSHGLNNAELREIIYDELFLILKISTSAPRKFSTTSIPYFSGEPDLINLRIEFENGTSANLTINRFLPQNKNSMELFRQDKMAMILSDRSEIRIICKETDVNEIIPCRSGISYNPIEECLTTFRSCISAGRSSSSDNGINAHKFISRVITRLNLAVQSPWSIDHRERLSAGHMP